MSDIHPGREQGPPADEGGALTGEAVAAMRLHPKLPRVTRLSRKVLIGLGLVAGLGVGGALIYALQTRQSQRHGGELYSTHDRSVPDGLAELPKSYSDVPKLGPPLPGDLGPPIVSAQRAGKPVPAPPIADPDPALNREKQERLREAEAARTAKLFAKISTHSAQSAVAPSSTRRDTAAPQPDLASLGLAPQSASSSQQDRQRAFLERTPDKRMVSPDRINAPASPDILQAGSIIPAALITGIRSDLPGQIVAQVTQNVSDSPTGRILLIPQGTRIVGEYDSGVEFGQRRVLLVWTRLIFPNGNSIVLERQPGADSQGYAGLEDGVDHHWRQIVTATALSTLLGVGAELATDDTNRLVQAIQRGGQDTINSAGQQIVRRQLRVAPTLRIRPGFPVRVVVTRDLILKPYEG